MPPNPIRFKKPLHRRGILTCTRYAPKGQFRTPTSSLPDTARGGLLRSEGSLGVFLVCGGLGCLRSSGSLGFLENKSLFDGQGFGFWGSIFRLVILMDVLLQRQTLQVLSFGRRLVLTVVFSIPDRFWGSGLFGAFGLQGISGPLERRGGDVLRAGAELEK